MRIKMLRGFALFLIIEIGLVHYFSSQHEFEESWILGYLFIGNFIAAMLAAYGIYRWKIWGWLLGLSISAASLGAYIWSRTSGLPGLRPEEWLYPWGMVSVIAEILFCLLVPFYLIWAGKRRVKPIQTTTIWRYLAPVALLIPLCLVNIFTYQLDARYPELDHEHVFFLWQVRLQPEISLQTLKNQYGMQVSLAAVSAMDSIVDVRLKILDPEKADQLLENGDGHFALLVGDELIPSPHINRHMYKNKTFIVFFPNQHNVIKPGVPISVVFESLRLEPITVE